MSVLLLRKLQNLIRLGPDDQQRLEHCLHRIQRVGAHEDIVHQGDEPKGVNLVLQGWACRYKQLEDGRRQIIALFVPGDMCDPYVSWLAEMGHSLGTLTPVVLAKIESETIRALMSSSRVIADAFWLDTLVSAEIQREMTVSLGRRSATERLAHLFCEIMLRLRAVGLTNGTQCELPLTQADLADTLGLSTVHVNRTLQELRATDWVEFRSGRLTIHNESALRAFALFDPAYLHLENRRPSSNF